MLETVEIAKLLIKHGADPVPQNLNNYSAFSIAVSSNNELLADYLAQLGVPIPQQGPHFFTSILHKNYEMIKLLSRAKAGINSSKFNGRSPLLHALHSHVDFPAVNLLIELGADLYPADYEGQTALMYIAKFEQPELLKTIIKRTDPSFINQRNYHKETALHYAAFAGNSEAIKKLVAAGADIDARTIFGATPLMNTIPRKQFSPSKFIAAAKFLLEYGAEVNASDESGDTVMTIASRSECVPEYFELLLSHGADPNLHNEIENHALNSLAGRGCTEGIKVLLKHGADINSRDNSGNSPLLEAINRNEWDSALLLIHSGADTELKNHTGDTPLHTAAERPQAIRCLEEIIKKGINPNIKGDNNQTALMRAVFSRNTEGINLFLDAGAEVNITDTFGNTALHMAIQHNSSPEIIQKLLNKGAEVNTIDKMGETPLMKVRQPDIAELLLHAGADLACVDRYGKTALERAKKFKIDTVVRVLSSFEPTDAGRSDSNQPAKGSEGCWKEVPPLETFTKDKKPLFTAVRRSDLAEVNRLVEAGAHINASDQSGETLLMSATSQEQSAILKRLLQLCDPLLINAQNRKGETALHYAVKSKNMEALQLLLQNGANPSLNDRLGKTALHLLAEEHFHIPQKELEQEVKALLKFGADINERDINGNTPLLLAAASRNASFEFLSLLQSLGNKVNDVNEIGNSILHLLAENRQSQVMARILQLSPDLEIVNDSWMTPFLVAASNDSTQCALLLLEAGAKYNVKPKDNKSAAHYAAISAKTLPVLQRLVEKGAPIDIPDHEGLTPLMSSIIVGQAETALFLIQNNADIHLKDEHGKTAIYYAAESMKSSMLQVVKMLIDYGAEINIKDRLSHQTPLMRVNQVEFAKVLIEAGADLALRDKEGRTALHHAEHSGRRDLINYLTSLRDNLSLQNSAP